MAIAAGLLALLFAAGAVAAILRASRRETALRRNVLAACADLLDAAVASTAPSGYGTLRGRHGGRAARLTPIAEALAFRRLPQLWVCADVARAGDAGSVEIVRRPTGAEFFTGADDLPLAFRPPQNWPQDTSVRGSHDAAPLLAALGPALGEALADPKLKSVAVTPRGVRVVRQAAQGERGAYLVFRETRFAAAKIAPEDAGAALDLALRIADLLEQDHFSTADDQEPDDPKTVRAA